MTGIKEMDTLYGGDENIKKANTLGVDVVSPVMGRESTRKISLTDFALSGDTVTACPKGHAPIFHKRKKDRYTVGFHPGVCNSCPQKAECPVRPGKNKYCLRYDEKAIRIAQRRYYEKTPAFLEKYRFRSGIEGTISYCDRKTGIKHLRVRGLPAVSFCVTLKAVAVNILRAAAFMKKKMTPNPEKGGCSCLCNRLCAVVRRALYFLSNNMTKGFSQQGHGLGIGLQEAA